MCFGIGLMGNVPIALVNLNHKQPKGYLHLTLPRYSNPLPSYFQLLGQCAE